MGFIAELEAGELELLRRLPAGDYYLTTDLDLEDAYIATATSRHLLDRGSRTANFRPEERQSFGTYQRQARF